MERLAARISGLSRPKDVIALYGDLGMGKSVFARAFVRSNGLPDEEVPSPTFTLVQTYEGRRPDGESLPISHFDLYRLKSGEEIYELGFEEALTDGVSLIEWPERAERLLPKNRLNIRISAGKNENARIVDISTSGKSWEDRLKLLKTEKTTD